MKRIFILLMFNAILFNNLLSQSTVLNGIVSQWNFNINFEASIGGASYNATVFGGVTRDNNFKRFDGSSAKFDRDQSGYLKTNNSPFSQSSHTYAAWYYLDVASITSPARYFVLEASDGSNWPASYGLRESSGQKAEVYSHDNGTSPVATPNISFSSGSHRQWRHIAVTYNSTTKNFQIFLDGVLTETLSLRGNATAISISNYLVIGGHRDGTGRCWHGWIDEVAVWNRVLTNQEITWLQSNPILQAPPSVVFNNPIYGQSQTLSWEQLLTANNGYTIEISRNGGVWTGYSQTNAIDEVSLTIPSSEFETLGTRQFRVRAKATTDHNAGDWGASIARVVLLPDFSWTGNSNTQWSNTGNWNIPFIPSSSANVTIPNVANKPIITSLTNAEAKSLTIDENSSVTINQGGKLTVAEDLLNNGTITIKSTATGDGSLITNTISGSGTYKVERYLASNKWHLVSSPITNAMSEIFTGIWLRPYNETTNQFGEYIVPTNVPLNVGQGFSNWTYNNEVRTFSGTVNNGTVGPIDLPKTNLGWNLIGNPYPSAIDWNAASGWTKNNVGNSIYVWNGDLSQYATWNGTSQTNGGSRYIPMGQGFFVQASSAGASIAMNNNVRVHNSVAFMKNNDPTNIIRIKVATAESSDESVIAIRSGVMDEFDYQFDATKLRGDASAPQLYTKKAETEAVICAYSDLFKVYGQFVYFEPASSSEHVLVYSHTLDGADVPLLFDHITGATIYPNVPYSFMPTSSQITKRFEFIKASPTSVSESTSGSIMVWESNGTLYIDNLGDEILKEVKVFDMQGKLVCQGIQTVYNISNLSNAFYLVKLSTDKVTFTKKILKKSN